MKFSYSKLGMCAILLGLVAAACGGGPQPQAAPSTVLPAATTASMAISQPSETPLLPPGATSVSTVTSQPLTAPAPTVAPVRKTVDVSRSNQPGFVLHNGIVETVTFGLAYNEKGEIDPVNFIFPDTPPVEKLFFAYAIENKSRQLVFTETLKVNGELISFRNQAGALYDVEPVMPKPSSPNQKQLRVKGLGVKAGAQFPKGQYEIEVYLDGKLQQKGIFHINSPKTSSALPDRLRLVLGVVLGPSWISRLAVRDTMAQQIEPDLFVVVEDEIQTVPDDAPYYDPALYDQALTAAGNEAQNFQDFPPEIQQAIASDAPDETCAEMGGTYDAAASTCTLDAYSTDQ